MSEESVIIHKNGAVPDDDKHYLVRWKNRQKMAWLSFWFMIFFTFILWFVLPVWYSHMSVDAQMWTAEITNSAEWLYITFGSVIIGYMGSTAYMLRGKKVAVSEEDY